MIKMTTRERAIIKFTTQIVANAMDDSGWVIVDTEEQKRVSSGHLQSLVMEIAEGWIKDGDANFPTVFDEIQEMPMV